MKRMLMIIIAILSFSAAHARGQDAALADQANTLAAKAILQNTTGYFVLSDGSFWKVMGFSKRWRTLNEWWNNVQLVPAYYECVPNDWFMGAQISAYPKNTSLEVNEADASNQHDLKQCTHLLVNNATGQVLFAIALEPAVAVVQLFNDAHEEGYQKGYVKGRQKSYENSTEIYNDGYSSGYKVGYAEGCQAVAKMQNGQ